MKRVRGDWLPRRLKSADTWCLTLKCCACNERQMHVKAAKPCKQTTTFVDPLAPNGESRPLRRLDYCVRGQHAGRTRTRNVCQLDEAQNKGGGRLL